MGVLEYLGWTLVAGQAYQVCVMATLVDEAGEALPFDVDPGRGVIYLSGAYPETQRAAQLEAAISAVAAWQAQNS